MTKKQLLIVVHSQSGRAEYLALALWRGARMEAGVDVKLLRALDACVDDILSADALVMVCAEHFSAASGGLKQFLDRVFYPFERLGKAAMPYALVISAGNDGTGCSSQIQRILQGWRACLVQSPVIVYGQPSSSDAGKMQELGQALAAGLMMGIY